MQRRATIVIAAALMCAPNLALAESAFPPTVGGEAAAAIRILTPQDVQRYQLIFDYEKRGKFEEADAQIAALTDDCLMGYVRAEHHLSPKSGRTPLKVLNEWLDRFGDLSIADRIFKLANRRAKHTNVDVNDIPTFRRRGGGYEEFDIPPPPLASDDSRAIQTQIEPLVKAGQPDAALSLLQEFELSHPLPPVDEARLSQRIAASYLAEGYEQKSYDLAIQQMSPSIPLMHWIAGLAAYRLGQFKNAAVQFEILAKDSSVPNFIRSQAAFWAARAYGQAGEALRVISFLNAAAREQPTFYGILAERVLGMPGHTNFTDGPVDEASFRALMQVPAARRAVALWQVGRLGDVPNEMNRALAAIDIKLTTTYAKVAHAMGLSNLELRSSEMSASRGEMLAGLFPVPVYAPENGYRIDPSLLLAFVRAESRFRPDATSSAGAKGLMQLLPSTAAHINGGDAGDLSDPGHNLALGQLYLTRLLDSMGDNLVQLAASYNAGPGNATRWMGKLSITADALLFMESIPSPETRIYVKRILMYHWLYARRLGRDTPSLDQTARGDWPKYHPTGRLESVPLEQKSRAAASP
ncbi:MAG: transglycosylase SLT domain-containing protein [Alphaproteobacteria bacterium]|nr:transglycosylase SLT domain-containing protein [Alphaproteobacteria bacterium]